MPTATTARIRPTLLGLVDVFVRYGNITLGGGSATIAVLKRELLDRRGWITADDFTVSFALARLTPGTNLLAFCTAVGSAIGSGSSFLRGRRATPGSVPATSQLALLNSITATIADSWSKATSERLKSSTCFIGTTPSD